MRKLLSAVVLVLLAGSAYAESVDDIIAKNLKARGGLDKLKAVQTMRMSGKMLMGPGMEAPFTIELKRPKRMRFEVTVQGMTIIQALDGDTGWTVMPFTGKKDPERMAPDDLKDAQDQADFDGPLVDYKQKGNKVELAGKEKIEGTDAYKLKVTKKNGDIEYMYLDADAYLEIKSEGKRVQRGNEIEFASSTGDYKEVSGMMFPFSVEMGGKGSQQKAKMTFTKIEVNPKIEDARFKMPAPAPPPPPAKGK